MSAKIYVIHENEEWVPPLFAAFDRQGLPFEEWHLANWRYDLDAPPPQGVFYSRMSASSHTRGHAAAVPMTAAVLSWLEAYGRRVVNGSRALALEVNKAAQYVALQGAGLRTPRTVVAGGAPAQVLAAAREHFAAGPLIYKPNRGGKGLGVQLFQSVDALQGWLESAAYEAPFDGLALLQEYLRAPEPYITRAEFIGGRFHYAVRVDSSQGFELCPADVCAVDDAFCPVGEEATAASAAPKFQVREGFTHSVIAQYERFLAGAGVEIAGIEFIEDAAGQIFTYDINTNTNYNSAAEAAARVTPGMERVAAFLGDELATVQNRQADAAD